VDSINSSISSAAMKQNAKKTIMVDETKHSERKNEKKKNVPGEKNNT
jgi:hypothetical protein